MCDATQKIFHDENKARRFLEAQRWPDGPVCPTCGTLDGIKPAPMKDKKGKAVKGFYHCNACRKRFTVRTGTLYERSHIPLHKWLFATHLMAASKKGISAHQLHRMLGVTYKSAWFMAHRIREGMANPNPGPIGGQNKVVEADETYIGGKAKNRAYQAPPKKQAVFALVEREGKVHSRHVADVSGATLREAIVTVADRKSRLMTDEAPAYKAIGKEYNGHMSVNHSANEYVRLGSFVHTNTIENYFSILKRGVNGTFHHVSEAHLHRYLAEFDFRYNHRSALGVEDADRALAAIKGIEGKRLTYRRIDEASYA